MCDYVYVCVWGGGGGGGGGDYCNSVTNMDRVKEVYTV